MITRVDIEKQPDSENCLVLKWLDGWKAGDKPHEVYVTDTDYDEMQTWFIINGWEVNEWKIGFRAWKGERKPVRTRTQIKRKRETLRSSRTWYEKQGLDNMSSLNLAFYL